MLAWLFFTAFDQVNNAGNIMIRKSFFNDDGN